MDKKILCALMARNFVLKNWVNPPHFANGNGHVTGDNETERERLGVTVKGRGASSAGARGPFRTYQAVFSAGWPLRDCGLPPVRAHTHRPPAVLRLCRLLLSAP